MTTSSFLGSRTVGWVLIVASVLVLIAVMAEWWPLGFDYVKYYRPITERRSQAPLSQELASPILCPEGRQCTLNMAPCVSWQRGPPHNGEPLH